MFYIIILWRSQCEHATSTHLGKGIVQTSIRNKPSMPTLGLHSLGRISVIIGATKAFRDKEIAWPPQSTPLQTADPLYEHPITILTTCRTSPSSLILSRSTGFKCTTWMRAAHLRRRIATSRPTRLVLPLSKDDPDHCRSRLPGHRSRHDWHGPL